MKTRSINSTNLNTGLDDPKQYLSSISNSNFEGEIWNLTLSNGSVKLDFSLIFNTIVDISNNNNCHSFEKILYDLKVIILKLIELNPKTNPTQSHYTGIILTLKFLSERKINTISKDNLADFFSYSLFKSSNNGIIQKRLKVIGHATMNNRHNLLLISNISKNNLGYYLLYCSKITEKHIEKSLENALDKSTKGMLTFHDWKEGGSFNFLTLDYGKYYIDHCRNFFKDNLPEAFAISKTLDNAREIVKISGLNRNNKEIKDFIIPILSNFISGVSVDNLPKSYKEDLSTSTLHKIMNTTLKEYKRHHEVGAYIKFVSSSDSIYLSEIIEKHINYDAKKYLQPIIVFLTIKKLTTQKSLEQLKAIELILNSYSVNSKALLNIERDIYKKFISNNYDPPKPSFAFYESLGISTDKSSDTVRIRNFTKLFMSCGIIGFVSITGWRASEYGFSINDITLSKNNDILDQDKHPIRYSVKGRVPKTHGKSPVEREIIASAYIDLLIVASLNIKSKSKACLYPITIDKTSTKTVISNQSNSSMKKYVRYAWPHFVRNYQDFYLGYSNQALNTALSKLREELSRVEYYLNYDGRKEDLKKLVSGNLSYERTELLKKHLTSETYDSLLTNFTEDDISSATTVEILNEFIGNCVYPSPHSFRHIWAEAVYRRYDGDVGWMITSQFKHISKSMFQAYIKDKDGRHILESAKRSVISSVLSNHILKKGSGYAGAMDKLLTKLSKKTIYSDPDHLKEIVDQYATEEVLDISSNSFGYCISRHRSMERAACFSEGTLNRHNASPSLCFGCPNNLTNTGNLNSILLSISNDMKVLKNINVPNNFRLASYKNVKQSLPHLIKLSASNEIIEKVEFSMSKFKESTSCF